MKENRGNQLESGHLKDAFWLVSEALYEVSKVLGVPAEMLAESLGLDGIRSKYSEIRQIREDQKLDPSTRALLTGGRDDRARTGRRDRDFSRLAVMALLSGAQQQRLGGIYDGIDGTRFKGAEIGKRLSELEDKLNRWHEQIMAKAARDPVTGKAIFQFEDGRVIDEDGNDVPADRVGGVDFTGKTRAEEKAAYDATRAEVDDLKQGLGNALGDLDTLEQDLNRRIAENPEKADEIMDEVERAKEGMDKRIDDIGQRADDLQLLSALGTEQRVEVLSDDTGVGLGGPVAVFKLP